MKRMKAQASFQRSDDIHVMFFYADKEGSRISGTPIVYVPCKDMKHAIEVAKAFNNS